MAVAEQIVAHVRGLLEREPRVNLHRYPLAFELAQDGTLTMSGEVESLAAKKTALSLAASVPGVAGIIDRLRVAPPRPMGDKEILDHLRDALLEEAALAGYALVLTGRGETLAPRQAAGAPGTIEIEAADGVVTLNGRVASLAHKRLAGLLAWWIPGIRDVVNGLEVDPPEADSDDEISDFARLAFEKDPLVSEMRVHARVADGVVTLEGLASSQKEREAAEADVWAIFGVDRVINHIQTER